jgi:hypothetical protein
LACHTSHGGKPFAGDHGRRITYRHHLPDQHYARQKHRHRWLDYGEFERAVRRSINHDGSALYPAMRFPSYARVTDEDMEALYAYFTQGVTPVEQANETNGAFRGHCPFAGC